MHLYSSNSMKRSVANRAKAAKTNSQSLEIFLQTFKQNKNRDCTSCSCEDDVTFFNTKTKTYTPEFAYYPTYFILAFNVLYTK